jgi:hypothetical protein
MIGSAVRLDSTTRADLDVASRREPRQSPPVPPPHGERVSISPEGRAAARESAPVARGEVRWYRATRYGRGRGALAANVAGSEAARPAEVSPTPIHAFRSPRLAIDAYTRAMRRAA